MTTAPWLGPIVALGGMARRYASQLDDRQLVVALTLPRRDFAAVLLACGWVISAPTPNLASPREVLDTLAPGTPVRATTREYVFEDCFDHIRLGSVPEAHFLKSHWIADHLTAINPLSRSVEPSRGPTPALGALARWAGLEASWHDRLASVDPDLALVGTTSKLRADLDARVAPRPTDLHPGTDGSGEDDTIKQLLLPTGTHPSLNFSTIHSCARLADELPLPATTQAVVLDGYGAIGYLAEIEAPFVFCVIDRSVANEASVDLVMQYRNSRGNPVSLSEAVSWRAPVGVEALAFTTKA